MVALRRYGDWPKRLQNYLRGQSFDWATNNCCLFASGAIEAMTGTNPAEEYRSFEGKTDALRTLEKISSGDIGELADKFLMRKQSNPKMLRRGDIALVDIDAVDNDSGSQAIGVVIGSYVAVLGTDGIANYPISRVLRGWVV